jgi:two-component system phosphoglycerate transport system response regulator PgtA
MQGRSIEGRGADHLLGLIRRRLLVVDEDLEDLQYYSAVLQYQGYEVRSIPSYKDGTAWAGSEDFDLILLSQGSPDFEGRSVLVRAIERDRHAPVVVLSRSIDMPCYIEAMQSGALDYMEKPLLPSEIGLLVRKYLRTRAASA